DGHRGERGLTIAGEFGLSAPACPSPCPLPLRISNAWKGTAHENSRYRSRTDLGRGGGRLLRGAGRLASRLLPRLRSGIRPDSREARSGLRGGRGRAVRRRLVGRPPLER